MELYHMGASVWCRDGRASAFFQVWFQIACNYWVGNDDVGDVIYLDVLLCHRHEPVCLLSWPAHKLGELRFCHQYDVDAGAGDEVHGKAVYAFVGCGDKCRIYLQPLIW